MNYFRVFEDFYSSGTQGAEVTKSFRKLALYLRLNIFSLKTINNKKAQIKMQVLNKTIHLNKSLRHQRRTSVPPVG